MFVSCPVRSLALRFLLASCWFICPPDFWRGQALLRQQLPEAPQDTKE